MSYSHPVIVEYLAYATERESEAQFGEGFYEKITKACFESDEEVRKLALQVVNEHEGKIFLDLDDGEIKRFAFVDGNLVFEV